MTKEEMLEQAVEINIDDLVYGSLSNPVKGQVEYCNKIMLISSYITLIATDHIEIGSNYRIDIYLPVEEIVNFETGQKITVVGQTTDEVLERSQNMADMTFTTYNYQMPVAYIVEEQAPTEEEIYQSAVSLMAENRYKEAGELLIVILDYKDSESLYLECCIKTYAHDVPEDWENKFAVLSGDEIASIIIDEWTILGGDTWIFLEDGTLDKGESKVIGHQGERITGTWSVEGDMLILSDSFKTVKYVVKQPYEGAIVLCYGESTLDYQGNDVIGQTAYSMWKSE